MQLRSSKRNQIKSQVNNLKSRSKSLKRKLKSYLGNKKKEENSYKLKFKGENKRFSMNTRRETQQEILGKLNKKTKMFECSMNNL